MKEWLPVFYRQNSLCVSVPEKFSSPANKQNSVVVTKRGEFIELNRSGTVLKSLKLNPDSENSISSIFEFCSYYPKTECYLVKIGSVLYVVTKSDRPKIVLKRERVCDLKVGDLLNVGRPLIYLGLAGVCNREILDVNRTVVHCGKDSFRNSAPSDLLLLLRPRITEAANTLSKVVFVTQKLIMDLKGITVCSLNASELDVVNRSVHNYSYLAHMRTHVNVSNEVLLGQSWSLILEGKLIVGIPVRNCSNKILTNIEFLLWSPSVGYRTVFLLQKVSNDCLYYEKSSGLPPYLSGILIIVFEYTVLEKTNFSLSGLVQCGGMKNSYMKVVTIRVLDVIMRNVILDSYYSNELILSLIATANTKVLHLNYTSNVFNVTDLLLKIGFQKSVHNYILYPFNSANIMNSLLVKISTQGSDSEFGCTVVTLYGRSTAQCLFFSKFMQVVLLREGYEMLSKAKELLFKSVVNLTLELRCLFNHLIENLPRSLLKDKKINVSSLDGIFLKYLNLLELEKCTDVVVYDFVNLKFKF